ncbi:MAG: hypothetical protein Q9199_002811 [Rusavskia elegans]
MCSNGAWQTQEARRLTRGKPGLREQASILSYPIESFFPVADASSFPVANASTTPVTDASSFPIVDASAPSVPDAFVFPVADAILLPVQPQPVQNPSFVDGISRVFIMKQQPTGLGSKYKTAERATGGKEQKSLGGSPEEVHDRSSDEDDYKSLIGGDELKYDRSDGKEEFLAEEDGELQDQEVLAEEDRDKERADHEGLRGSYSGNSNNVGALEKRALFNAVLGQPGLVSNGDSMYHPILVYILAYILYRVWYRPSAEDLFRTSYTISLRSARVCMSRVSAGLTTPRKRAGKAMVDIELGMGVKTRSRNNYRQNYCDTGTEPRQTSLMGPTHLSQIFSASVRPTI